MKEERIRIEAARRRLRDLKERHTSYRSQISNVSADDLIDEMAQIACSASSYLDGESGPYRQCPACEGEGFLMKSEGEPCPACTPKDGSMIGGTGFAPPCSIPVLEAGAAKLARLTLSLDGNMWCALYGTNLQDGVAGFGDTPDDAVAAFNREFRTVCDQPPIPIRAFDWSAWVDGREEWKTGRGATEEAAIRDLLQQINET